MSADNGIYILNTRDGYRVLHTQAIDNIYWWFVCCDNPDVKEIITDDIYYKEKCFNCNTEMPKFEKRNEICPDRLKEYFGKCEVFITQEEAIKEAQRIYEDIMDDDFCPIVEYGICEINYDKNFPS